MTVRHGICCVLAAGHIVLIACGAARLPVADGGGTTAKVLQNYGALTGADATYGFFAPGVSPQLRASFILDDGAGRTWTAVLDGGGNREVELRIGSILGSTSFPWLRDAVIASWAARMFARQPDAQFVLVRIEVYDLPTMEQYRAGTRPEWNIVHEAGFFREEADTAAEEN
jgi:hypothetical protein